MIAGCQDRFLNKILSGFKRHTIRRGKRWRAGMRIDLFLDVRQKNMRLIFRAPVTKAQDIEIFTVASRNLMKILIDGTPLEPNEFDAFAQRDGFESAQEMYDFWTEEHGANGKGDVSFTGQIIHWDFERRTFEPVRSKPRATSKACRSKRARRRCDD